MGFKSGVPLKVIRVPLQGPTRVLQVSYKGSAAGSFKGFCNGTLSVLQGFYKGPIRVSLRGSTSV